MFNWGSGNTRKVEELKQQLENLQQRAEAKEQENSLLKRQVEAKEQENSLLKRDLESQSKQNDQLREQFTEYVRMEEIKKTVHGASDFIKDLLRPWQNVQPDLVTSKAYLTSFTGHLTIYSN